MSFLRISSGRFWLTFLLISVIALAGILCVFPPEMVSSHGYSVSPLCADSGNALFCSGGQSADHFRMLGLLSAGIPQMWSMFMLFILIIAATIVFQFSKNKSPGIATTRTVSQSGDVRAGLDTAPCFQCLRSGIMHPKLFEGVFVAIGSSPRVVHICCASGVEPRLFCFLSQHNNHHLHDSSNN